MAETNVRTTFKTRITEHYGQQVLFQRIEDKFGVGIPDSFFRIYPGREYWCEFKEVDELPKRPWTPVRIGFRPGQVTWLEKNKRLGGESLLCVKFQAERVWMMFNDHFRQIETGVDFQTLQDLAYYMTGERLKFPNCLP